MAYSRQTLVSLQSQEPRSTPPILLWRFQTYTTFYSMKYTSEFPCLLPTTNRYSFWWPSSSKGNVKSPPINKVSKYRQASPVATSIPSSLKNLGKSSQVKKSKERLKPTSYMSGLSRALSWKQGIGSDPIPRFPRVLSSKYCNHLAPQSIVQKQEEGEGGREKQQYKSTYTSFIRTNSYYELSNAHSSILIHDANNAFVQR